MILLHDLQAEANRLGFFVAGVTSPETPPHIHIFENWLASGHHGGMDYLASERSLARRRDPLLLMPGTRSIVVLGFRHAPPLPATAGSPVVAAYSSGQDYHLVMKARLAQLAERLSRLAGRQVSWSGYSDSAPILERSLASRAGLGWIGRNSCLLLPGEGSFFLLAEIFLDEWAQPLPDHISDLCGNCHRCIDSCPTGCILPDRTIDARRCISFLTIENKGIIPLALRQSIGSLIFGCDVCQVVCPWNSRPLDKGWDCLPELKPLAGWPPDDLNRELLISTEDYKAKFQSSSVSRARRKGYLRNIAVVLGNRKDPQSVPFLERSLLEEPEPLVRAHSAWALGQINNHCSRRALDKALKLEPQPWVRLEITMALAGNG